MASVNTPAALGRRACAVLAAFSAGLHALMLGQMGNPAVTLLLLAMIAACLFCARDLWIGGSVRAWCVVAVMNLGMVALHWSVPACHHGSTAASLTAVTPDPPPALMSAATAVAAVEATIAAIVLYAVSRARAARLALR